MTYVRGGAGPILILSVCRCQEHTRDLFFYLCDPFLTVEKSGLQYAVSAEGGECCCLYDQCSHCGGDRSCLNTVGVKSKGNIIVVVVYKVSGTNVRSGILLSTAISVPNASLRQCSDCTNNHDYVTEPFS